MKPFSIYRIRFLTACVFIFALTLIIKLYMVQIVNGEDFSNRADRQYIKPNQSVFNRGTIFFESKEGTTISAATVKEGFTLAMHPNNLENPEEVYQKLVQYIPIDRDSFMEKAAKKDDPYEELVKKIDRDIGLAIDDLGLVGVGVYKENWRYYPGNKLASHSVGLIGYGSDDELAGRYGLERYYEDILKRDTDNLYVNFFAEVFSNIHKKLSTDKKLGGDIVATIEPTVQSYLETVLEDISEKWASDSIGGIVINPKTGAIYAMGAYPTFNPNNLKDETDPRVFSNPLVENVYEMGSIVKPLTMAAGLDSGVITPETTYNDEGSIVLNTMRISNYDGVARGVVPMQEVLSQSLNTGAAYIATKMGAKTFSEYMLNFGLSELTGIDQPNEQSGITDNLQSGREIEIATASYGQGIAFTPIATVRALSALANGGTLVTPHLVKRIEYKIGLSKKVDHPLGERVISEKTSEDVTRMLVEVVDSALNNGQVKMENYSIAAKTGTAQMADNVNGGYSRDRYLHSFFGYFPAYDPEFLVFLYQVNPKGVAYASETLTYPFIDIVKFLINYYEVAPDR